MRYFNGAIVKTVSHILDNVVVYDSHSRAIYGSDFPSSPSSPPPPRRPFTGSNVIFYANVYTYIHSLSHLLLFPSPRTSSSSSYRRGSSLFDFLPWEKPNGRGFRYYVSFPFGRGTHIRIHSNLNRN